jgi:hypothetical protein
MRNKTRRRSLSRREVIGAVGAGGCALLAGCPSRNEVNSVEVQNETTAVRSVELLPGERRADFSNKIVVRSDVTYTVRVRVDGEKTQSGRWNVQDEEMLVRVRESGEELDAVFADGCPQRAYGSGPSVQVYNLTGTELATRLTVESTDASTTARRQGSRTRAPTVETRSPSPSAGWSMLVEEEFTIPGRSAGSSARRYCGVEQGRTRVRVSTDDGRERSGIFSLPDESVTVLVVVFGEEIRLLETTFCHFGC